METQKSPYELTTMQQAWAEFLLIITFVIICLCSCGKEPIIEATDELQYPIHYFLENSFVTTPTAGTQEYIIGHTDWKFISSGDYFEICNLRNPGPNQHRFTAWREGNIVKIDSLDKYGEPMLLSGHFLAGLYEILETDSILQLSQTDENLHSIGVSLTTE